MLLEELSIGLSLFDHIVQHSLIFLDFFGIIFKFWTHYINACHFVFHIVSFKLLQMSMYLDYYFSMSALLF